MKLPGILLTALALTACGREEPIPESAQDQVVTVDGDEMPVLQQLLPQGSYRLAGVNGQDVNLGHAVTVSVSEEIIAVASQCVTPRWRYEYVDDRLRTEPIVEPMCERGRYPEEEAIAAVIDDPKDVLRTPANGIYIAGGGQSITLFSQ